MRRTRITFTLDTCDIPNHLLVAKQEHESAIRKLQNDLAHRKAMLEICQMEIAKAALAEREKI